MRIGRLYLVALGLAIVGLAAYAIVPKAKPSGPVTEAQMRAMEHAALQRLRLPSDFVRVKKGCSSDRCYLVSSPSTQVVAAMPSLLRADGIQRPGPLRAAEPIAGLKLRHWSTASRDPLVIACTTTHSASGEPLGVCQDAGRVGSALLNVLVTPYRACSTHACVESRVTEVLAWAVALPSNG
jgi:hypothetical protein